MAGNCDKCGAEINAAEGLPAECPNCGSRNSSGNTASTPPPVNKPPVSQPPVSAPPVSTPPVSNPSGTLPPAAQPPSAQPPVTQPPTSKPPVANPPAANPQTRQPQTAQPPITDGSKTSKPPKQSSPVAAPPVTSKQKESKSSAKPDPKKSQAESTKSEKTSSPDSKKAADPPKAKAGELKSPPSAPEKKHPKTSRKKSKKKKDAETPDELLPQKSPTGPNADLLPTANQAGTEEMLPPVAASKTLPAGAGAAGDASAEADPESSGFDGIAESERVVLPDGDGGFVEVSERKTTVTYRGAKVELNSLKRGEKDASRSLKNFIVMTFCFILLITLMIIISYYAGPTE